MKKWNTGSSFGSSKTLQNLLKPQKESDNLPTRMLRIVFQMAEEALTFIHQNITGFACITAPIPSSWPPWDHSPFGRIHGHNSFNSFNAFMNEKRKLQRTFFHQLLCPSFSKANLSSFPSPLWKYLYIISMSNLWGSPNQDVQWQKFLKKKTFQVWCAPPCLVFSSWRGGMWNGKFPRWRGSQGKFLAGGGDAVDGRNPKSS